MPRATDGPRRARVLVLLDATAARLNDDAAADYVDALATGLDGDLVITCRRSDAEHYRRLAPAAIVESGPRGLRFRAVRMLWRQFALPRIARRHDVDAVHSPWPPVPLLLTRPRVVTVHDLSFYDAGQPVRRRAPLRRLALRAAVRISDEIIVPGRETAVALERATAFPAGEALVLPATDRHDAFVAAHRVAYRSAAALVPAETGPITLPLVDETPLLDGSGPEAAH
ncbi:glycosyltransferase [Microcella sp.]|uniref:glycosyltransferase n=1 Tax=Microcella sp. TaxID=1913979 RepID=UPI002561DC54|nr:glycosyltransferase [Microcella sp.]MBX9472705.1 glycosyltransferase [Microcella sp.]